MRATLMLVLSVAVLGGPASQSIGAEVARDSYAIVHEDATETSRVVSVRIERRLDSSDLARIATTVRDASTKPSIRHTVVSFYLPGMAANERPWASVDTTPTVKVIVGGLSLEEAQSYAAELAEDGRKRVGAWLTDLPAAPGRITILSEKGKPRLEWVERSGARTEEDLVATRGTRGTRFDLAAGGEDYYLMRANGELEHRRGDRLLAVFERLKSQGAGAIALSDVEGGTSKDAPAARSADEPGAEHETGQDTLEGQETASAQHALPAAATETNTADSGVVSARPAGAKAVRVKRSKRGGGASAERRRTSPVFVVDYMRPQIVN